MNRPVKIPPTAGVPPAFVAAVNNRLLLLQQGATSDAAVKGTAIGRGVGAVALYANGMLAIQADAAPAVWLYTAFTPASVAAYVKTAPTGAGIALTIYAGSTAWVSLTIAAGATQSGPAAAPGPLPASQQIRLAITAVGTTVPGADLSVFLSS